MLDLLRRDVRGLMATVREGAGSCGAPAARHDTDERGRRCEEGPHPSVGSLRVLSRPVGGQRGKHYQRPHNDPCGEKTGRRCSRRALVLPERRARGMC